MAGRAVAIAVKALIDKFTGRFVSSLYIVAMLAALYYLAGNARVMTNDATTSIYDLIESIEQSNALLHEHIVLVRFGILQEYDTLDKDLRNIVEHEQRLRRHLEALAEDLQEGDTAANVMAMQTAIAETEQAIEIFKSNIGVYRNALSYLPFAVEKLKQTHKAQNLHAVADELLIRILMLNTIFSEYWLQAAADSAQQLQALHASQGPHQGAQTDTVDALLAHVAVILQRYPQLHAQLELLKQDKIVAQTHRLGTTLQHYDAEMTQARGHYLTALVMFSLLLMLLIIANLHRLRSIYMENMRLANYPRLNPYPMLCLDKAGAILDYNPAARRTLEYLRVAEGPEYRAALLPDTIADLAARALSSGQDINIEHRCAGKDWLITLSKITDGQKIHAYYHDITDRKRVEEAIESLARSSADVDVFGKYVLSIAKTLNASCVFIGIISGEHRDHVRVLAIADKGRLADTFEYPLAGTPCADTYNQNQIIVEDNVQQIYPDDALLVQMKLESYFGTAILNQQGVAVGHLVVMFDRPMKLHSWMEKVFDIYVSRISIELERNIVDTAIRTLAEITAEELDIKEFFEACVRDLARAFSVEQAFIVLYKQGKTIAARRAWWVRDHFEAAIEYPMQGTICQAVLEQGALYVHDNAQELFPQDERLRAQGIRSFYGHALLDEHGEELGHVAMMSCSGYHRQSWMEPLLNIFVKRISLEIQRYEAERKMQRRMRILDDIAAGLPVNDTLARICLMFEKQLRGALAYIVQLDSTGKTLQLVAAPSVPDNIVKEITNASRAVTANSSCARAIVNGEPVYATDSSGDAPSAGHFKTSWSTPFFDEQRRPVGAFTVAFTATRMPESGDKGLLSAAAAMCALAVQRYRDVSKLREQKERAEITLKSIGDAVLTTDESGRVAYLNPNAERLTGWKHGQALGLPTTDVYKLINEVSNEAIPDPVMRCLSEKQNVAMSNNTVLLNRNGERIPVEDSAAPIRDHNNKVVGVVLVFHDVQEQRELKHELSFQASHDALTGLINRREFERRLEQALITTRADNAHHVLLYIDLDQFKLVNDTCGHMAGDELLRQLAVIIEPALRQTDVLGRLGGDEFGALLLNCSMVKARNIAATLLKLTQEFRFVWMDRSFSIGASIGMVAVSSETQNQAELLSNADMACYTAKEQGRNRIHEFSNADHTIVRRKGEMEWVSHIREAIELDRFVLYTQSIVAINGEHSPLPHFEVLLRMDDGDEGILEPSLFIPAAERYGLMHSVDRWVIRHALRRLHRLGKGRYGVCSINLSGASLGRSDLGDFIKQEITANEIDPVSICFEITETAAISNFAVALRLIRTLRAFGCKFALDDFGSGLSSYSYLKQMSVDYLKIDGAFVRDMLRDSLDRAIVTSANDIAHAADIKSVAEWVENQETLDALREIGVDYVQGYIMTPPRPMK